MRVSGIETELPLKRYTIEINKEKIWHLVIVVNLILKILTPNITHLFKTAKLDKPPTLKIPKDGGLKREYCINLICQTVYNR